MQPTAFPIGTKHYSAKNVRSFIQLFKDAKPSRPFERVAQLNEHIEKSFLIPTACNEALPQWEELARQQSADALTTIVEKKSRLNETYIYNVTATAVAFTDVR